MESTKTTSLFGIVKQLAENQQKIVDTINQMTTMIQGIQKKINGNQKQADFSQLIKEIDTLKMNMKIIQNAVTHENAAEFPPIIKKQPE
jgi:peptidoglycan hydrolase CwlO-like protein